MQYPENRLIQEIVETIVREVDPETVILCEKPFVQEIIKTHCIRW